jgi:biotin transport system substrate-specific component
MVQSTLNRWLQMRHKRALRIAFFTVVILISAQIRIQLPNTPVPFTLQTLGVLLAGMALGPMEGVGSVFGYLALVALGIDGRGAAVFVGPTGGFLIGFLPAALIAGLAWRSPERVRFALSVLCGLLGVAVTLVIGMAQLATFMQSWSAAFMTGVVPFMFVDAGKVLLAASLVRLGRESWLRWFALGSDQ